MIRVGRLIAAAALFVAASPALAEWHEARSKHFIIYADENPKKLREFAEKLERFDKAVRIVRNMEDHAVGDGNRLTVFVVRDERAVQRFAGNRYVSGFYLGRASGSLAFVPERAAPGIDPDIIFFHEYAHHLMLQELERPYPRWLIEGFAELVSTAKVGKDGSVELGHAAQHRAHGLLYGRQLPLKTLLGGDHGNLSSELRESVYGRGWLLSHFLSFEPSRRGQLTRYVTAIAEGIPPLDAAQRAFGDLNQLEKDLESYLRRKRLVALKVSGADLEPGPIDVQPLSRGAAAVLPLRMESKYGVTGVTAGPLAAKIRQVQARHPGDYLVEVTLAEAELDAGNSVAAEAAATRALQANPRGTEALIYKGRAIAARASGMDEPAPELFAEARRLFIAANKIDPEDPEPLLEFYRAYLSEGQRPTENALAALHYASNLAPQDLGLRMNSAIAYLEDGKLAEARKTLAPVAYSPHGGGAASAARRMIELIDTSDARGAIEAASAQGSEGEDS